MSNVHEQKPKHPRPLVEVNQARKQKLSDDPKRNLAMHRRLRLRARDCLARQKPGKEPLASGPSEKMAKLIKLYCSVLGANPAQGYRDWRMMNAKERHLSRIGMTRLLIRRMKSIAGKEPPGWLAARAGICSNRSKPGQ